jgi:CRP/FNR family transcriptional regulator
MKPRHNEHSVSSCFTCQNRHRTEWCVLTEPELERFNRAKVGRAYGVGEFIYHEGDPSTGIYCLESGLVAFRKYDVEGNATLMKFANPGHTLGYRSFLEGGNHITSAEAVKPSHVCFIEKAVVRDLLDYNPALGYQFLHRVAKDLGRATERFHQGNTLSVRDRFIHLLLILKGKYASAGQNGEITIDLPLSRQDLAALVGTRPETLARTIRQMEDEGVAEFKGRHLHLPDPDALFDHIGLLS